MESSERAVEQKILIVSGTRETEVTLGVGISTERSMLRLPRRLGRTQTHLRHQRLAGVLSGPYLDCPYARASRKRLGVQVLCARLRTTTQGIGAVAYAWNDVSARLRQA